MNLHRRLRGLIPIAFYRGEAETQVGWGKPLAIREMPMMGWATRRAEELVTTDLGVLFDYAENFDDAKFVGAIIHVSRCGSTALANAFKAIPDTLVLSEPDILCHLIRERAWGGADIPDHYRRDLVRGFLGAVVKENPATNVVVKCSSASTITLDQTLRYLPRVPWCFLSRAPADVIASLESTPGMWLRTQAVRERILLSIGRQSAHTSDAERSRDLYAFLLERFYVAAMEAANSDATFIDYSTFGLDTVCAFMGQTLRRAVDDAARGAIATSLQLYSKAVVRRPFVPPESIARRTGYHELDAVYDEYLRFIGEFTARRSGAASFATGSLREPAAQTA